MPVISLNHFARNLFESIGEAASGSSNLKKDTVPYDGSKSHISTYNFCYLCKERLDTHRDETDEGWYFVDTRQVRFTRHVKG